MAETLSRPTQAKRSFKRVAILFSGGPAPAANAVISTAAVSFLRNRIEVVGLRYGYSGLMEYSEENPLVEGENYLRLTLDNVSGKRCTGGIFIGTARANPGKHISSPEHMSDPKRVAPLKTVDAALRSLGVDALISIGGDDTLKTANKFKLYQEQLPEGTQKIPVVHLPKTIDNDYMGIDFTFGYFTAVEMLASEIRNLLNDAAASGSYFLTETMGRSAGWLGYGAAIAGEASLVISVEDITGDFLDEEIYKDDQGAQKSRPIMNIKAVVDRIVDTMVAREEEGHPYGVIAIAEGLAEYLPLSDLKRIPRDDHGHISIADVSLGRRFAKIVMEAYTKRTGKKRKVTGLQLGYEARCNPPHAFDIMLGSQLGVGAYRALVEEKKNGVMVSVVGQLDLQYVPFEELVDPETLVTKVRFIEPDSDFHKLARFLETYE
ncbi:MAG: 6-phosphofructokinase [Pirellulaceae bacterium]|nr:6-phosphofructokinase [Pirellulaceae bacterium]